MTIDSLKQYVDDVWIENGNCEFRIWLGLIGELGECAELTKKLLRDNGSIDQWRTDIKLELGDLMYNIIKLCSFYDLNLDEIVALNKAKMKERYGGNKIDD